VQQIIDTSTNLFKQNIQKTTMMLIEYGVKLEDCQPLLNKLADDFTEAFIAVYKEGKKKCITKFL